MLLTVPDCKREEQKQLDVKLQAWLASGGQIQVLGITPVVAEFTASYKATKAAKFRKSKPPKEIEA